MGPQHEERRLTTILAADVVGYSRLMGEDEAGALAALKTHCKEFIDPKAEEYHGRTVKLMGDGARGVSDLPWPIPLVVGRAMVVCGLSLLKTSSAAETMAFRAGYLGIEVDDALAIAEKIDI